MKNTSPALRQIIFIFVIGLLISTFLGDFNLGGLLAGTGEMELKSLFDTLSMVLAVISLVLGTGYLVYRAARGETDRKSDKRDEWDH